MPADGRIHVHALIHALAVGGAELLLGEFAKAAPRAGIDLTVGYFRDQAGSPAADRLRSVGVEPQLVPVSGMLNPAGHRRLRSHLRTIGPDIVHTHIGSADFLGGIASRLLGIPTLSTLHGVQWSFSGRRTRLQTAIMSMARRRCADRVVAVSESARSHYLAAGLDVPERVVTIPNGIDGQAKRGAGAAVRRALGIDVDEPLVLMLSALRPEKSHATAIAAVRRLRERHSGPRLLIVGDGPSRAEIEVLAAEAGPFVTMAGYQADAMAVLDAADVLLHPSLHDAFPTTLLEAMAASVPIVATGVDGILEMVDDGENGVLLPAPPTPEGIATGLARVLDDASLRRQLADAARKRFEAEFTLDRWVGRTRLLYEDVLATSGRHRR